MVKMSANFRNFFGNSLELCFSYYFKWWMDGLSVWSSTPARGPQDGPNVHHGLSFDVTITYFFYLSWVHGRNNFCVAFIWFSRQSVVTG
jgi:hypothetical protein